MRLPGICAVFLLSFAHAQAQELVQVTWLTKLGSKPAEDELDNDTARLLPAFRVSLGVLSERQVVSIVLATPAFLGLDNAGVTELRKLGGLPARGYGGEIFEGHGCIVHRGRE